MKKMDIEKLNKRLAYKELSGDYFSELEQKTLAKISQQDAESRYVISPDKWVIRSSVKLLSALSVTAAAIALFVTLWQTTNNTPQKGDEQITDFVANLSDSDLELLVNEAELSYEFYTNL